MSAEYPHKLTRDSMANCRGCCDGVLCEFHEGFNDGVEAALTPRQVLTADELLALLGEQGGD